MYSKMYPSLEDFLGLMIGVSLMLLKGVVATK